MVHIENDAYLLETTKVRTRSWKYHLYSMHRNMQRPFLMQTRFSLFLPGEYDT